MRAIIYTSLLLFSALSIASKDVLTFKSSKDEARYYQLIEQLRCPKCLNQSIADSNAGISEDLRNIVYEKINQGHSNEAIKQFLKQRYGDFILYQPEVGGANLILWFGPVIVMLIVATVVVMRLRKKASGAGKGELTDEQQKQVEQLLKQSGRHPSVTTDKNEDKGSPL
ncbi:cytochrome c-type biogenesis protein [Pleionea mediterranea]|uniref:Cytochrome c-type biogenesis protein n=1 Tax=Pleionea mediterranea TaxID=523701 RepID=A0A316FQI3_9GAMM|nr:cytochrome c-type biogenesis protein [Pleionea mediterranea]PWK49966.1 cytochrome c-type biogenesis protein CcmH [Pleionea mediterranea]